MDKPKHTPGPWFVGAQTPLRPTRTIYHQPFGLGDIAEVFNEDDASLIAAAPDMLAALELVEACIPWGTIPVSVNQSIYAAVRAAIAQAKGEA